MYVRSQKRFSIPEAVLLDHTVTYKAFSLRSLPARKRKGDILRIVKGMTADTYADVGCSTGYITDMVAEAVGAKTVIGYDRLNVFPGIYRELDISKDIPEKADLLTCFETIEHVPSPTDAVTNLLKSGSRTIIISVPIETGLYGFLKTLIRTYRYNDPPHQLNVSTGRYLWLTLFGSIRGTRVPAAVYSSHCGFDYRVIDEALAGTNFRAVNKGSTRFYIIEPASTPA